MSELHPLLKRVAELDPGACSTPALVAELERQLESEFPWEGPQIQALGATIRRGVEEGWLAHRGEEQARFSRVAKASEASFGLSVDVVSMTGAAVDHTHPKGEVTLGFPAGESSGTFEGRDPAWVFLGPGSRHLPTVVGGRMNLIYFLPDGAVTWHFD